MAKSITKQLPAHHYAILPDRLLIVSCFCAMKHGCLGILEVVPLQALQDGDYGDLS
jgi:hypothetical protein